MADRTQASCRQLASLLSAASQIRGPARIRIQAGVPSISKAFKSYLPPLYSKLARPVFPPATTPLNDWTDWRTGGYWDGGKLSKLSAPFIRRRGDDPDIKAAVQRAFRDGGPFVEQHVAGVNALQRVGWTINQPVLEFVKQYGGKVGEKKPGRETLAQDISMAESLVGQTFYVPHNCCFRGRLYGVSHFNFMREDHVRSLFLFAEGKPIKTKEELDWLMIHVANCGDFGKISKRPWGERLAWVNKNRDRIANPTTDGWWHGADKPFCFVAACLELTTAWDAWDRGENYTTRLPGCFDRSCSGIQHLAAMVLDEESGKLVNLIPQDEPADVYQVITNNVIKRLEEAKKNEPHAEFWLARGITRPLIKRPAMTFAYSVTDDGMRRQIVDVLYKELRGQIDERLRKGQGLAEEDLEDQIDEEMRSWTEDWKGCKAEYLGRR